MTLLATLFTVIAPLAQPASAGHGGCDLNISPENDTNPTGTTHTLTATIVAGGPSPETAGPCTEQRAQAITVDFEIDCVSGASAAYTGETGGNAEDSGAACGADAPGTGDDIRTTPDMQCTINANPSGTGTAQANSCTVSYSRDTDGQDEITGWVDEDNNDTTDNSQGEAQADNTANDTDVVAKFWSDPTQQQIDCGPEGDTNPTGTQHTVTCTVRSAAGANPTLEGADVDYQVTGANPTGPQHGCTTGANGTCSFTYTGNNAGNDVIQAFVNQDGNHTNNDCGAEATGDAENDDFCDQVEKTWQARTATFLDVEPETDTNPNGTTHTLTATFTDQFGDPIELSEGQLVDFEIISGPNANFTPGFRDFECPSNNPTQGGTCTASYTDAAAFDANNATDTICAWLSNDGDDDQFDPNGAPEDGGDCDLETPNETEQGVDPNNQNIAGNEGNDITDTVLKTWTAPIQAPATQVNAEPETDTNPVGTQHTIRVFAGSSNNQPTTATNIRGDILPGSANASQQTAQAEINCTIDDTGAPAGTFPQGQSQTHECTYTGTAAGTDTIRVFADSNGNNIFNQGEPFDDVTKTWSGQAFALAMSEGDSATAGTCNEFTVRITDQQGNPVVGQIVDVSQTLQGAGTEPNEDRELAFCNPQNAQGPNPTGVGGTAFGDVTGNNPGQTAGQPGRNTTVRGEVGPTNNNGEVTFGITINNVPTGQTATVNVRSWVDTGGDNDQFDAGEPTDTATKTWTPGGGGAVTSLNAEPETATNPNGTQHQVTVTLTPAIQGVTPNSIIANNAAGRPQGDVADANAGTSPNAAANTGNFNVYSCTPSNAQGVSTCTFQDPLGTAAGTDTIVFYVNQASGGTAGPDAGEPQDAVQKTWTAGPQNLIIDLRCAGTGTNDDQDVAEQGIDNPGTPDCTNPLSDQDEVFTAIITNAQNIGQQNIRVDFSFGQRTNGNAAGANNSTNDATLNATPGGQVGTSPGGLQTFCLTDATGRCSVTLTNATPQAGDTIEVIGVISGQTVGGPATDGATKQWQTGVVNQGGTITLTPRAATNQVGTQHTVTATVRNQFGQPVQGANVDFDITSGPNAGLAQAGMTDAVTDANGNATFTYTSNALGTDTIEACSETGGTENDVCNPGQGEPQATASKTWQSGPVTTNAVALDMDADDQAGVPLGNPGGCELTTGGADPNRESTATNTIDPTPGGQLAAGNFHRICAAAFQTNQAANNGRLAGAQITFTIAGPGRIFAANANGNCATNAVPPAGTTVTVTADNAGFAFACLFSQQVGRTTVTASSGNPAQTATGTKDWTVSPSTARFIQLCHGDVAGTTCDTAPSTNEPNDDHEMTARVTDAQGNPVANVPVQFRETGPGIFIPQGGSSATVLTDANGLAAVLLTSDVVGDSSIVAEIDPGNTTARQAGAGNDQCEAPAGTNNQPAAGNCVSQTLTKLWRPPTVDPECDNGIDDDGDGFIDEEDPSCDSPTDDDESPFDEPPPPDRFPHDRRISIRFNDGTGARGNGLVVFGRLRVPDGFNDCRSQQPINIQRRISGRWVTKKTTNTNRRGRYAVEIFDQASRYRAVAVRTKIEDLDNNRVDICKKAVKAKRHRHRR
ncbi:MAG: Ig-like domain-containing protein [Actinomycetota bacterium]|nr:Ig-like domain-containing protein [Actinomycetota bacterium]